MLCNAAHLKSLKIAIKSIYFTFFARLKPFVNSNNQHNNIANYFQTSLPTHRCDHAKSESILWEMSEILFSIH